MQIKPVRFALVIVALVNSICSTKSADISSPSAIRHSYLVLGGKTAIIGEDGKAAWEYDGGSRDGFVLPSARDILEFPPAVRNQLRFSDLPYVG